jgi:hypothetical protein
MTPSRWMARSVWSLLRADYVHLAAYADLRSVARERVHRRCRSTSCGGRSPGRPSRQLAA